MKHKLFLAFSFFNSWSFFLSAQIDFTTGVTGTLTGVAQSYNETRAIDITVLTTDVHIKSMTLRHFEVGPDATALVGARIYLSSSGALLFASDTTIYNIYNGSVRIPFNYALIAGETYRIGFYCGGPASDNTGFMFQPTAFPYIENKNLLRINQAYATSADAFPQNMNIFVPPVSMEYDTSSTTGLLNPKSNSEEIILFPDPVITKFAIFPQKIMQLLQAGTGITSPAVPEISIYNVTGLKMNAGYEMINNQIVVNCELLPSGVYFLDVVAGGNEEKKLFVVQK